MARSPRHRADPLLVGLGRYLLSERQARGMTQAQFAKSFGMAESSLSRLEVGNRSLSLVAAVHVCDGLGITLDELVARAREMA